MLVISNHVKKIGLPIPRGAVVRINIAWLESVGGLAQLIWENSTHDVWVDYPTGRKKPPVPKIPWFDCIHILKKYKNVKYFAFSNAEEPDTCRHIRKEIPAKIKLVPKIETVEGVRNLVAIAEASKTDMIMFDKEDLYSDLGNDPKLFEIFVDYVNKVCKEHKIQCLSLQGVIFA